MNAQPDSMQKHEGYEGSSIFASMFSAIGEILSRIAMQVTIDRLKVAVQTSLKSLGADHVGCVWQINIEDPSYPRSGLGRFQQTSNFAKLT